jgi:hypothetical protein
VKVRILTPTPPGGLATQDIPLPNAPATAPMETEGWKTVEGKATQRKKKNEDAGKTWAMEMSDKPPMTKNGGQGKNSHQPQTNNTSAKKTCVDVIKSGGINLQIVLGNGNLGLTTPMKTRGEMSLFIYFPPPGGPATQDTPLPDAPATASVETDS